MLSCEGFAAAEFRNDGSVILINQDGQDCYIGWCKGSWARTPKLGTGADDMVNKAVSK
jgi:hypothetical protein